MCWWMCLLLGVLLIGVLGQRPIGNFSDSSLPQWERQKATSGMGKLQATIMISLKFIF